MNTKSFTNWLAGLFLLVFVMAQVAARAQSGPPPLPDAAPIPGAIPGLMSMQPREVGAQMPPLPPLPPFTANPSSSPLAPEASTGHDSVVATVSAAIIVRTATTWIGGPSVKAGEAAVSALGSTFTIPLYSQEGRITETVIGSFGWEGKAQQAIISQKTTATLYRFFRLEGTNIVFLPEVQTNRVNPLP